MEEKRFLTSTELARMLGVDPTTIRHWIRTGKIRALKTLGGHFRISWEEAERVKSLMGIPSSPRTLTIPQILDSLRLERVGDRAIFGNLLECLLEGGMERFTPSLLSRRTGYPLEVCRRFCEVMASAGYLVREADKEGAETREGEIYRLAVKVGEMRKLGKKKENEKTVTVGTFTFTVTYQDPNGDSPSSMSRSVSTVR